jgi:hypothetical protein
VAIVVLSLLSVVPASALDENAGPTGPVGPSGPSVTAPPGDENAGAPSGRPSTTSPTKPPKDDDGETDSPKATTPDAPAAEDLTPSAGPPEVSRRGIVLPDDSLLAAMEELNFERAKVEMLGQRRLQLDQTVQEGDATVKRLRKERREEQEQRSARAVAAYRGQSSGWRLGAIVEPDLADERAVHLVGAADEASRDRIKQLGRDADRLAARVVDARHERGVVEEQLDEALARLNRLLDKLAASNGTITTINGELVYVPTGPSPIAILAHDADQQVIRLMATNAPLAGDARWQSTRHSLALELARVKDGNRAEVAAAIERDWDATPTPVLHAMLFALRQVGKAYVYATAGPETFDCSGLTKAAYAQIRLGLPHFSGAQLHLGVPVPPESIRPGDLLAYGPDGADHVTMAIGGGIVVEAKGRAYGVIVAPARVDPAKGFAGATRIVP